MITFAQLGNMGRMGNAMFQIAATVALAKRNNDVPTFPHWKYEKCFNLPEEWFVDNVGYTKTYNEPFFHYSQIPYSPNINTIGYFQSILYWQDWQDYIRQIFSSSKYSFRQLTNTTSVHIRRGDYLNFPNHHTNLGMDYYSHAMEICRNDKYLIFSDDMNWCRNNFRGNQFEFSEGNDEVEDLFRMAACEKNIIANSSFSWWGAWLNNSPNKTVVAPQRWFGPALPHDTKDLIPNGWVNI